MKRRPTHPGVVLLEDVIKPLNLTITDAAKMLGVSRKALSEFVNYAILGISTFSNKIEYTALFANDKIQIRILSIFMPISIVLMAVILLITNILKKENFMNFNNIIS